MNRTQHEALYGKTEKTPCIACEGTKARAKSVRLERHRRNKEKVVALMNGIQSGKVIPVWFQDEFTGWHYIDYKNNQFITGKGE